MALRERRFQGHDVRREAGCFRRYLTQERRERALERVRGVVGLEGWDLPPYAGCVRRRRVRPQRSRDPDPIRREDGPAELQESAGERRWRWSVHLVALGLQRPNLLPGRRRHHVRRQGWREV